MAEDGGAMDIRVHPLVVLHIADHYTREFQQQNKERVIGCMMGVQDGRVVNVFDAFEMAFKTTKEGNISFEQKAFETDLKLFKEAYPSYECLGWYSTGSKISQTDSSFHKIMTQYNERPLYLLFDAKADADQRELPVVVYEEVVHISGDKTSTEFVPTAFKIESEEAERVTAVHCAKVITNVETGSVVAPHYQTLTKAIGMLNSRIKVIHQFLKDVSQGKLEADHKILRQIKGLCNRLPTMQSLDFKEDLLSEYNDALLVTYLATITKSTNMVNEVVDKFNVAFGSQGRRRGGPPAFYM